MDNLYVQMKVLLSELYEKGSVTVEMPLFFKLYKLVCDMKQIENVVRNL